MGQTVDNGLRNINITENYITEQNIQSWKEHGYDKDINTQTTNTGGPGYSYVREKDNGAVKNTVMDNFEEYLKARQDRAKEEGVDEASKEREEKENEKEIVRNLSSDEIAQLRMMGIDISSASLDDIMGMVNTMRGNTHREEMKAMMAEITASNGNLNGLTMLGGSVEIAGTDIKLEGVNTSDIILNNKEKINESITLSEEEISFEEKTGVEKPDKNVQGDFPANDDELVYIVKNNLTFTKENMYKAHYSGSKAELNQASQKLMQDMMSQIEKVIQQAGYEVNDESLAGAKFLMDNQLPINTDNIKTYMEYQEFKGKMTSEIDFPAPDKVKEERANQIYEAVKTVNPGMAYEMVAEGRVVTIASLISYSKLHNNQEYNLKAIENYNRMNNVISLEGDEQEIKAVTAMRQVEELRLSMTMEASYKLISQDINIDTREISKVVAKLKDMEQQMIAQKLKWADVQPTEENISLYREINDKVNNLGELHARVLAAPLKGEEFTVQGFYRETITASQVNSFEAVRRSYEAVGTAPRADMGDSISKAFSNVKDILNEMKISVNSETERAVRILGYNSLEITEENINQIVNIDRQVNDLIDTFYPEAVLGMIKDGINPLDVPIDELNKKIKNKNYNKGVTEADNFATYLRDMEALGEVTPEERESYIGIYRAISRLEKSGDREAGWLFANDARLTVRNLISAMRSRRASGIDVSIDESFGMLEQLDEKGKAIDAQIEKAFDTGVSDQKLEEIQEDLQTLANVSEETEKFMLENNIEITAVNVMAVNVMVESSGGVYQLVSDVLSKMKFKANTKEELVDEETENITDSLLGQDVETEFAMESILESLRNSDEMSFKYEDLRDRLTELMYNASLTGSITSKDIATIKTVNAGFNIMSGMAKNDKYQIPVETKSGIKVINLTINHNSEKKGTIEISLPKDDMGDISAVIRVGKSNSLYGSITMNTSDGNYMLINHTENIISELNSYGFAADNVGVGSYKDFNGDILVSEEESLYKASVALIKVLSAI